MHQRVDATLNNMVDDKACGPNGFPIKFLKECWDVVGSDVMAALVSLKISLRMIIGAKV